jgi:hypothetical protein
MAWILLMQSNPPFDVSNAQNPVNTKEKNYLLLHKKGMQLTHLRKKSPSFDVP